MTLDFTAALGGAGMLNEVMASAMGCNGRSAASAPMAMASFARCKTLRTTPAMAANVTKRLWEIGDIVDVLVAWENTI